MSKRKRGMFSEDPDRKFLRGDKEYQTIQGKRDRQATIRQRLYDGILDFVVVQEGMTNWNWRKFVNRSRQEDMELENGIVAAIALFYEIHHAKGWDFSTTLRYALDQAYTQGTRRQMPRRIVEGVEFEPKTREPERYRTVQERIEQKVERGEELTDHEKVVAFDMGGQLLNKALENKPDMGNRRSKQERIEEAKERVSERNERHGEPDKNEK